MLFCISLMTLNSSNFRILISGFLWEKKNKKIILGEFQNTVVSSKFIEDGRQLTKQDIAVFVNALKASKYNKAE